MFVSCIVYSVFFIVLCIVSPIVLSLSYFCTSLPTTATGWIPSCGKSISYHISKTKEQLIPVATRYKAWLCGSSLVGLAGGSRGGGKSCAPPHNPQPRGAGDFSSQTFSRTIPHILNRNHTSYLLACEDGTDTMFGKVDI
jgi:hypothetical protein